MREKEKAKKGLAYRRGGRTLVAFDHCKGKEETAGSSKGVGEKKKKSELVLCLPEPRQKRGGKNRKTCLL